MIIVGYPGIGKTTLAESSEHYIDLESSCFNDKITGRKTDNWFIYYCNMAEFLSAQGYTVFVSSHKMVQRRLKTSKEKVFAIVPCLELKEIWIYKLRIRAVQSGSHKDWRAYRNAVEQYDKSIKEIQQTLPNYTIQELTYNLKEIVEGIENGVLRNV